MHNFNNPEYSLGGIASHINHPVYNPKTENISSLISNSDNHTKLVDTISTVYAVPSKTKTKVTTDLAKKVGVARNKREPVKYIGTPPLTSHKIIKQSSNLETDESDLENDITLTNQTKKINNSTDVNPFNSNASEIVSAMNGAPSPPKFALTIEASTQTNVLQSKTKHHLPLSCLKQAKIISPNNTSINNSTLYNPLLIKETNQLSPTNNINISPTSNLNTKATQVILSEQIRSPPVYEEAVEQLKRSTISGSDDVIVNNAATINTNLNESQKTTTFNQNFKLNLNQDNQLKSNNTFITPPILQQQASKIHKNIYSKSNALHKNKHSSHILQETELQKSNLISKKIMAQQFKPNHYQHLMRLPTSSNSQYFSNNNYKDSNLLNQQNIQLHQQQQINYEQKQWPSLSTNQSESLALFSQHENNQLKYGNIIEDSSINSKTFCLFQSAKSEPKHNFDVIFL